MDLLEKLTDNCLLDANAVTLSQEHIIVDINGKILLTQNLCLFHYFEHFYKLINTNVFICQVNDNNGMNLLQFICYFLINQKTNKISDLVDLIRKREWSTINRELQSIYASSDLIDFIRCCLNGDKDHLLSLLNHKFLEAEKKQDPFQYLKRNSKLKELFHQNDFIIAHSKHELGNTRNRMRTMKYKSRLNKPNVLLEGKAQFSKVSKLLFTSKNHYNE